MSKSDRVLIISWVFSLSIGLRYIIGEPQSFGSLQYLEYLRFSLPLSLIVSTLILAYYLNYLLADQKLRLILSISTLVFILISLRSLFVERPDLSLYWLLLCAIYYFSALALVSYLRKRATGYKLFLVTLATASTLQALLGITQFALGKTLGLRLLGEITANDQTLGVAKVVIDGVKLLRPVGLFPHANIFAGFLIIGVISTALLITHFKSAAVAKWTPLILGLQFIAILVSFSRSAWIALTIVVLFYGLTSYGFRTVVKFPLLILMIAMVIGYPGIQSRFQVTEQTNQLTIREDVNRFAYSQLKENYLFGVGLKNSVYARSQLAGLAPYEIQPAHNSFLLIAAELGLITTVGISLLLIALLWRLKANKLKGLFGLIAITPLLFLDHYLASISYGIGFVALLIVIFSAAPRDKVKTVSL